MAITLNREQRVFLLKALKDNRIDLDELEAVGIRTSSKFDHMTDEELEDEIVRLESITRNIKPIYEDKAAQRICKECYKAGGCWVSWMARDDRELHDKIAAIMREPVE